MNFTYENQGTNTYLVYTISEEDTLDTMSLGMLTNNKILGLATTLYTQIDTSKYIKYNISAKVSASQFFSGVVNKKRLISFFEGIVDGMMSAEEYMIDVDTILLDMDYIFADVSTCEATLVCLPLISTENKHTDLGAFFKNIMFSTQFDQTENCDYIAKIMNHLNSTPIFSLTNFKELLGQIKGNSSNNVQVQAEAPVAAPKVSTMGSNTQVKQPPVATQVQVLERPQPKVEHAVKPEAPVIARPSFEVPGAGPVVQTETKVKKNKEKIAQETNNNVVSSGKKISALGLLMHYSKENAELYKAQKAAKKDSDKKAEKIKNEPKASAPIPSFSIPGQQTPLTRETPSSEPTPFAQPVAKVNAVPQPTQPQQPIQPIPQPQPQQPVYVQPQPVQNIQLRERPNVGFGDTTVLMGNIGQTTVLNATNTIAAEKLSPYLIRLRNNEKIPVNKPVFRIGKERSYVDYFVGDNTAISRSHANIVVREDGYFVVDTNSTNHTFVNGQMIPSNSEVEIVQGTKIRLGNEDFEFILA